jgi:hypothetical protein
MRKLTARHDSEANEYILDEKLRISIAYKTVNDR